VLRRRDSLTIAAAAFVAANLIHTADHFRQGTGDLTWEILAGGSTLTVLAFVVLALALARHPRAALFAAVVGVSGAIGISAAHLPPHWSALSDSYPDIGADALSWAVVLLEIAAAAALGAVGLRRAVSTSAAAPASALPRS
jgi:hypothetical protein